MAHGKTIQLYRGTASQWTAANPVLAAGEPGLETDTNKVKYGDGTTAWNSLSYASGGGGFDPTKYYGALDPAASYSKGDIVRSVDGRVWVASQDAPANSHSTTPNVRFITSAVNDSLSAPATISVSVPGSSIQEGDCAIIQYTCNSGTATVSGWTELDVTRRVAGLQLTTAYRAVTASDVTNGLSVTLPSSNFPTVMVRVYRDVDTTGLVFSNGTEYTSAGSWDCNGITAIAPVGNRIELTSLGAYKNTSSNVTATITDAVQENLISSDYASDKFSYTGIICWDDTVEGGTSSWTTISSGTFNYTGTASSTAKIGLPETSPLPSGTYWTEIELFADLPVDIGSLTTSAQMLAYAELNSGSNSTVTTTSTSSIDINSALTVTFTAPASGTVVVRIEGMFANGSGSYVTVGLRDNVGVVSGTERYVTNYGSSAQRWATSIRVTGLTPNTTYNWKAGWRVASSSTTYLYYGSNYGPATMEVWSA